ncbi:MAG: hypothetical protein JWP97_5995 [Labilithrix sp.]|nr:hypothetical protein [Labilithrix sp.]
MKVADRTLAELRPDLVLAPERHVAFAQGGEGVPLRDLVVLRSERVDPSEARDAVVLDTSHVRDGLLDVAGALRDVAGVKSAKKRAHAGDLVVSRLRPYLRQIALVHPEALGPATGRPLALSTEFYVLAPRSAASLAFLLPFLLSPGAQEHLASAQEGGHHPRVPVTSLLALRVPHALIADRAKTSRQVLRSLAAYYVAASGLRAVLDGGASGQSPP